MMKLVVLSCLLAAASASAIAPLFYSAYAAPLIASNYRGPLSLAPGQPADILGADGRPLDTLDVNLDRAAHYTAKALEPFHLLKKRSAAFIAPISTYALASSPLITAATPISYAAPLAAPLAPLATRLAPLTTRLAPFTAPLAQLATPLAPLTYPSTPLVHVLKKRSVPVLSPISKIALAPSPLIATTGAITYSAPYAYGALNAYGAANIAPLAYTGLPLAPWYKK